jgi:cytosine/adenosine deaminase-related metal-dependent hydrolase
LIRYHAAWVLPIVGPPVRNGWVAVEGGRIVEVGGPSKSSQAGGLVGPAERHLGAVAILPGLVNAHTHLELSYLRGQVAPAGSFVSWIRDIMAARRQRTDPAAEEILGEMRVGIEESRAFGTALVGDISNTLVSYEALAHSRIGGVVFFELIRFNPPDADALVADARTRVARLQSTGDLRASVAAHAPYSVAPAVFDALGRWLADDPSARCSVHLSESPEEIDFLRTAGGAWRALLEDLGAWDPGFSPPGASPVEYLDQRGFLGERVVAVHGVQMSDADLRRLADRGVTLVACPRSNRHTGAGVPPIERFYASGVRVAVGTDSLASSPDLNVFEELATMRAIAPSVPPSALLASATLEGARALGLGHLYGSIEPGKRSRLIAVDVPEPIVDVEEYLVTGVRPEQIRWLE